MLVDLSEIAGLVDPARDVRRFSESAIIYLELMIIAVCGIVPIMILMAFMGLQRRDCENWRPKDECDAEQRARDEVQIYVLLSWVLPLCLAGVHLVSSILACFDCFRRRPRTTPSIASQG
ncbi:hypothetical protein VTG60DRAFT_6096 [Thermothelomyces hinnuleus]